MRRFAQLFVELDATTRTSEKVAALRSYFESAAPEDAAWALRVMTGGRFKRAITSAQLRRWAAEAANLPDWLIDECRDAVGDTSETIALVLPEPERADPLPLHELAERWLEPMRRMDDDEKRRAVMELWSRHTGTQRFVLHKLMSGTVRVGAGRILVIRALAETCAVPQAVMQHRLTGGFEASADALQAVCAPEGEHDRDIGQAYPFYLASPIDGDAEDVEAQLGSPAPFAIELKWDGIRAQVIRRSRETLVWSRGEELIGRQFPEIVHAAGRLPDGTVIDGEIVAWDPRAPSPNAHLAHLGTHAAGDAHAGGPLPFAALQRRLNRVDYQPTLFDDVPVRLIAYDVLEDRGEDIRERPLDARRARLEEIIRELGPQDTIGLGASFGVCRWSRAQTIKDAARDIGVEGVMLKRRDGSYKVGRTRGEWWKWKVEPLAIDAVLIHAQPGSGRRASLFTDYTFGVWDERNGERELVPVCKAYSGLTDHEIKRVDHFVRTHIVGRHGPIRVVEPRLVFEIGFEGIAESARHKSGVALRFPRMLRWREDKVAAEADTMARVRELLNRFGRPSGARAPRR